MKITQLSAALALAVPFAAMSADTVNDWENLEVNSIDRLPARTYSMPLANEAAALADVLDPETPWKMSLNGMWKISCISIDCSLPGSSVHGILQARILERVAMPSSRGSSQPRD